MSEVMIVDPAILKDAPKAFRDYVETYFVRRTILGRPCLVAGRSVSFSGFPGHGNKLQKGIAPSHSMNLSRWKDGLKKDETLSEWIRKREEKGDGIWCLCGPSEPSSFDDDD